MEWRKKVLYKTHWNLDPVIGIQKIAQCRNRENWHRTGLYISKHKGKCEKALKNYQAESE
jgi:hypothetical protein